MCINSYRQTMFLSTHWLLYHLTTIMHHSALHFSFINRICLLSTLQCGLPMAACDDWQAVNIHRFWSFWRECAHLPYLNTRRDSQAVMQDISHPGMIHFVSLSLFSHSPVRNLLPLLLFLWDGGVLTSFSKGCYSGSVDDRPVKCPFSKSGKRFICSHAPLQTWFWS